MKLNLTWSDSAGDQAGFNVYRSVDGTTWMQIGTTGSNTFADTSAADDVTYEYAVDAVNASEVSSALDAAAQVTTPLNAPVVVNVVPGERPEGEFFTIRWTLNSVSATNVSIQCSSDSDPQWTNLWTNLSPYDSPYTLDYTSNYNIPQDCYFRMQSFDASNNASAYSNVFALHVPGNPPVANNVYVPMPYGTTVSGLLSVGDLHTTNLSAVLASPPSEGTVSLSSGGSFTYTAGSGFDGTDSFTYYVTDGYQDSNIATVDISSIPPTAANSAGIAINVAVNLQGSTSYTWNGGGLTVYPGLGIPFTPRLFSQYYIVQQPSVGSVSLNPTNGGFTYNGPSTIQSTYFTYIASTTNGTGGAEFWSSVGEVFLTNLPGNSYLAGTPYVSVFSDTTFDLSAAQMRSIDTSGLSLYSQPAHGVIQMDTSDIGFTYTPQPGFVGPDAAIFLYPNVQPAGYSAEYLVMIFDVTPFGAPPNAPTDLATTALDGGFAMAGAEEPGYTYAPPQVLTSNNPDDFVILTDDKLYTEDPSGQLDNMDYNTSLIETGQLVPIYEDEEYATILLQPMPQSNADTDAPSDITDGELTLTVSQPADVRLYYNGYVLTLPQTLNVADPTGPLAPLVAGAMYGDPDWALPVEIEGIHSDPDLSIIETYTDMHGHSVSQVFHMAIASVSFSDSTGAAINGAMLPSEEEMVAAAAGAAADGTLSQVLAQQFEADYENDEFTTVIDGLPASAIESFTIGGVAIPVSSGLESNSAETNESALTEPQDLNLTTAEENTLTDETGDAIVPQYGTIQITTANNILTLMLPTYQYSDESGPTDFAATPSSGQNPPPEDFFFDGTDNDASTQPPDKDTNVFLLYHDDSTPNADKHYYFGVGTETAEDSLGDGAANGYGAAAIVQQVLSGL